MVQFKRRTDLIHSAFSASKHLLFIQKPQDQGNGSHSKSQVRDILICYVLFMLTKSISITPDKPGHCLFN